MLAARNGHKSVVKFLIKAGASLDIQDNVGVVDSIETECVSHLLVYVDVV